MKKGIGRPEKIGQGDGSMRISQGTSARAATAAQAPGGSRVSRYRWIMLISAFLNASDDSHTLRRSRTAALQRRSDPHRLDLIGPSRPDCISFRINHRF
jgi:hypothetical protein